MINGVLIARKNVSKKDVGKGRCKNDITIKYFEPCGHDKTPTANLVVRNNIIGGMFSDVTRVHFLVSGRRLYLFFDNDASGWKLNTNANSKNTYASVPLFINEFRDWIIKYGGDYDIKYDVAEKAYYIGGEIV